MASSPLPHYAFPPPIPPLFYPPPLSLRTTVVYYADAVFQHLGDLVDEWMTFNEVISICELGYERDTFAPGVSGGVWVFSLSGVHFGEGSVRGGGGCLEFKRDTFAPGVSGERVVSEEGAGLLRDLA